MAKEILPPKLYYSITEVSDFTDLKPHILRYWETEFAILRPKKNRAGNRAYRDKDIQHIQLIKKLLYEEGYTIEGAKKRLRQLRLTGELDGPIAPGHTKAEAMPLHEEELPPIPEPVAYTRSEPSKPLMEEASRAEIIELIRQDILDCLGLLGVTDPTQNG